MTFLGLLLKKSKMDFRNIFSRKKDKKASINERSIDLGGLYFSNGASIGENAAMRLSAVYCAVNQISNSVASLPIRTLDTKNGNKVEVKDYYLKDILNLRPEEKYSHFNFFKLMTECLLLKGNAYAYIERDDKLKVKALRFVHPDFVTPMPQANGDVKYVITGMSQAVDSINMIHLYQFLDTTTHKGMSVLKHAANTLAQATNAESTASNFFSSGGNLSGIIKSAAPLTNEQKKQIKESWGQAFNNQNKQVSVAVLPSGLDYQPIAVNPEDAQLLDSRKFSVIEIARFFNISPIKLFDLNEVSYSSMESTELYYLNDTIYPIVQLIEEEFNKKLFKPSEVGRYVIDFDFTEMLSTNKETEAKYYREMLVNGILSLNEVREKMGYGPIENGDEHFMQLSYSTIKNIASGALINGQSQGQSEQSQDNKIDNKVK